MAIIARLNNTNNIGKATIRTGTKASIIAPNFAPKPNVALTELRDTSIIAPEDGAVVAFNTTLNKFEAKTIDASNININKITGGTF